MPQNQMKLPVIEIEVGDVQFSDRGVKINDPQLVRALVKAPKEALELMQELGPISLDDIDIDKSGRVVIHNKKFADLLKGRFGPSVIGADANGICGLRC